MESNITSKALRMLEKTAAFRLIVKNSILLTITKNNLPAIRLGGKDLRSWISDYCSRHLPPQVWSVDGIVGGHTFGRLEDAEAVAGKIFEELAQLDYARRLRDLGINLKPIRRDLMKLIERKMQNAVSLDR